MTVAGMLLAVLYVCTMGDGRKQMDYQVSNEPLAVNPTIIKVIGAGHDDV